MNCLTYNGKEQKIQHQKHGKNHEGYANPEWKTPDDARMPLGPDPETRQVSGEESGLYGDGETASPSATSNSETRESRPKSGQTATQDAAQTSEIKSTQAEQNIRPLLGLGSSALMTSRRSKDPTQLRSHLRRNGRARGNDNPEPMTAKGFYDAMSSVMSDFSVRIGEQISNVMTGDKEKSRKNDQLRHEDLMRGVNALRSDIAKAQQDQLKNLEMFSQTSRGKSLWP